MGIYVSINNLKIELIKLNQHCAEFLSWNKGTGTLSINNIKQEYYYHIPKEFIYIVYDESKDEFESVDIFTPTNNKFITDYNWIINVKKEICDLNTVDEFNIYYDSVENGYYGSILPAHNNTFQPLYSETFNNEFDCILNLIYNFFNKYYFKD